MKRSMGENMFVDPRYLEQLENAARFAFVMVRVPDGRFLMMRRYIDTYSPSWVGTACRRVGVDQQPEETVKFVMYLNFELEQRLFATIKKKHLLSYTWSGKVLEVFVVDWPSTRKMICSGRTEAIALPFNEIISRVSSGSMKVTPETKAVLNVTDRYLNIGWENENGL